MLAIKGRTSTDDRYRLKLAHQWLVRVEGAADRAAS